MNGLKLYLGLFLTCLCLSSCSEVQLASHVIKQMPGVSDSSSQGSFKVGRPYKIAGVWYKPQERYNFTETGIASWYGPQFHGKKTANGEIFNMNELTAAHRTLQLPSIVRVTNLENGRSLVVRVNDRGPFKRGRVIDLSRKSAELLGFKNNGTARVKLQVLGPESREIAERARRGESTRGTEVAMNDKGLAGHPARTKISAQDLSTQDRTAGVAPKPVQEEVLSTPEFKGRVSEAGHILPDKIVQEVPVKPTNMFVQAGSFSDRGNAQDLARLLSRYADARVYPADVNGKRFYRVRLGPVADVAKADKLLEDLAREGRNTALIIVE